MILAVIVFLVILITFMVFPFVCIAAVERYEDKVRRERIVERTGFIKLLTMLHLYNFFSADWL
jgi:branched-subunit amino acid transport protein AzlD